jgi:hypothetical protein
MDTISFFGKHQFCFPIQGNESFCLSLGLNHLQIRMGNRAAIRTRVDARYSYPTENRIPIQARDIL